MQNNVKKKNVKIIISLVVIFVLFLLCLFVPSIINYYDYDNLPKEVYVSLYDFDIRENVKEITITDEKEIKELSRYVKRLDSSKRVDKWLDIMADIKIKYDDSISISVQIGEDHYCYYTKNGEDKLVVMPRGLMKWLNRNFEIE